MILSKKKKIENYGIIERKMILIQKGGDWH